MDADVLVQSTDLVALVEGAGVTLRRNGNEHRGVCPLHNGTNPTGFAVYVERGKQKWVCFTGDCGSGDAIDFVMRLRGVGFVEAMHLLGGEQLWTPAEIRKLAEDRKAAAEIEHRRAEEALARAIANLREARVWEQYHRNLDTNAEARKMWEKRGIPEYWQDYWQLGYCPAFGLWRESEAASSEDGGRGWEKWWESPTLTIPVFEKDWSIATVRHRLLRPPEEGDKYRPDRAHLKNAPWMADPDIGIRGKVLIVEGEIKAAVTSLCLDQPATQVVGIPGKKSWREMVPQFQEASEVYVMLDPDAEQKAEEMVRAIGVRKARLVRYHDKVDDAILRGALKKRDLERLMGMAARVR